jgi:hypothetical protein
MSFLAVVLITSLPAQAEELSVGKRAFAVTLTVEDPLVDDELLLPAILHIKRPGTRQDPPTRETELSGELFKALTPNLGLALAGSLTHLDPDGAPTLTGFDNLEVRLKYVLYTSAAHEANAPMGGGWEVGGTGRQAVARSFDVVTSALFWGKGFCDLPDDLRWLKPLAVTGLLASKSPTK